MICDFYLAKSCIFICPVHFKLKWGLESHDLDLSHFYYDFRPEKMTRL